MPTRKLVTRYAQDLERFPDRWHRIGLTVITLLLVTFPASASNYWLGISLDAMVAIVGSVAMMILTGFAGQVSLGHVAFLAIGAYTASILGSVYGVPFWLCLPAAGFLAAAIGLLVGPFALRLEGLYLAIVTVGLLFLVQHTIKQGIEPIFERDSFMASMHLWFETDPVRRSGLGALFDDTQFAGLIITFKQKLYFIFLAITVTTVWISHNLQRSRTGRAMMSVRDRDNIAAVLGIQPPRVKFIAFGLSSFLAGIAGAMYAWAHPTVSLDVTTGEPFSLTLSVLYLAMVVLGGVGTTFGAVWGALALTVLFPLAEHAGAMLPFPSGFSSEQQGAIIFFPLLCLFLLFEPLGLLGIWLRIKRYFMGWPFKY